MAQVAPASGEVGEPLEVAVPIVTSVPLAAPTAPDDGKSGHAVLLRALQQTDSWRIEQKVGLLEGISLGIIEQANTYTISPITTEGDVGEPVFVAREVAERMDLLCCAPNNSLFLEIYQASSTSQSGTSTPQAVGPAVMVLERPGMKACCVCQSPKPCLCCFSCADMCREDVTMHRGAVTGKPGAVQDPTPVGRIVEPKYGGGFTPTLHLMSQGRTESNGESESQQQEEARPFGYLEGRTFFGGCTEFCCSVPFPVSREPGTKSGNIAMVQHLRPSSCGQLCKECFTDIDRYGLEFKPDTTPEERAEVLGALFLAEYMWFENDGGACFCRGADNFGFTVCSCFCCGVLIPCSVNVGRILSMLANNNE